MLQFSQNQRNLSWAIAWRYLGHSTKTLSSVGRLAFLGLVISVAVLVIVISVVNGFERELRERVMAVVPSMKVHGIDQAAEDLKPTEDSGIAGWGKAIEGSVLLTANGHLKGAQLTGIDPTTYGSVSALAKFVDLSLLSEERFVVVLGAGLARSLGVEVGDPVRLILPAGGVSAAGPVPRQRNMRVVDILESRSQLDSVAVYTSLDTAKVLFRGTRNEAVHVRLEDLFSMGPSIERLRGTYGEFIRIETWQDTYGPLYQAIAVQKLTMLILLSFLVAVAAFNLVSGLIMIVERRREDVAIMSTFGMQSNSVLQIFLLVGGLLALVGILFGLISGVVIAVALPHLFEFLTNVFNLSLMSQYFISYLPVDVRLGDLLVIGIVALILGLLATVAPARRATKLEPSEVLAHE